MPAAGRIKRFPRPGGRHTTGHRDCCNGAADEDRTTLFQAPHGGRGHRPRPSPGVGVGAVWGAGHSCSPGRKGARERAASLQVRACRALASTSSSRRKLRRTLQDIFGSRAFWRPFVISETRAAVPPVRWRRGQCPGPPGARSRARGRGVRAWWSAGDLGGGATLRPAFASVAPSAQWGHALAAGLHRPARAVASVPLPPGAPSGSAGPQGLGPHARNPSPTRSPRRSAATEPAGGNLPAPSARTRALIPPLWRRLRS